MLNSNTLDAIITAKKAYDNALKNRVGITDKKLTLSNILISHAEEIIETALDAEHLMKKSIEDGKKITKLEAEIKKTSKASE